MMINSNKQDIDKRSIEAWNNVKKGMFDEFGESTYSSWFNKINLKSVQGYEVFLTVPTRFISHWINNNYINKITSIWQKQDSNICKVTILVLKKDNSKQKNIIKQDTTNGVQIANTNVDVIDFNPLEDLGSPLDMRFSLDNFVCGHSNMLAYAVAKQFASSDETLSTGNPLYINGSVGLGKTHLLHGIALDLKTKNPEKKVMYLSAERFMYEFVKSLREKSIMDFKHKIRSIDVLLIDDVQFICGKESTQEEFFHTCNSLLNMNKKLVISGDRNPSLLDGMDKKLSSRLEGGVVVDIKNPDFKLRLDILKSKASLMKIKDINNDVLEFIAVNIFSNVRQLEGALNKVYAYSTILETKIDVESVKGILSDLLSSNSQKITIEEIQKAVASYYSIKVSDILSVKRTKNIARPRQIAMLLCKELTVKSFPEIGRKFGNKNHTTVLHAVKRINELCLEDKELAKEVNNLRQNLEG